MPRDVNALPLAELYRHFAATALTRRLFELARDEDLGTPSPASSAGPPVRSVGDITTAVAIPPDRHATAALVARAAGVIAGLACIPELLDLFAPACTARLAADDGHRVPARTTVATLTGPLHELLELERTMLNTVGRLSGIATRTAEFAAKIPSDSRARLYDTRKTTPGLRVLEKYAVRCGGGYCHRVGLFDAVLIKDNHLAGVGAGELASVVARAAAAARAIAPRTLSFIEVEVESLEQLRALLTLPPGTIDIVLLDNMPPAMLRDAATLRDRHAPALRLEASGGVTLESIGAIATTGVDRISVGGLTHHAVSLDVALDITETHGGGRGSP